MDIVPNDNKQDNMQEEGKKKEEEMKLKEK